MAKGIKILHCADLHLGSELNNIPSKASERRTEVLGAFRRLTGYCGEHQVDLLLIAGDLFEGANIEPTTIASVKEYLAKIEDTIVAIAPGNHDYYAIDSPYAALDWPANVLIFKSAELVTHLFSDKGFSISGAAFTGTYSSESLLASLSHDLPEELVNLCVLHGDLVSEGGSSDYNPITQEDIGRTGFDYIALGHIHQKSDLNKIGATYYAYSGCLAGQGFDELGLKGFYTGLITKENADLKWQSMPGRQFLSKSVNISGLNSQEQIIKRILEELQEDLSASSTAGYREHFYKIILTGLLPAEYTLPLAELQDRLAEEVYFVKLINHTRPDFDLAGLARESSLKGIFVRLMLDKIAQADKKQRQGPKQEQEQADLAAEFTLTEIELLNLALQRGLQAFENGVLLDDY